MIVTRQNFDEVLLRLAACEEHPKTYGFDTETTGLRWKDRIFSMQIATEEDVFYFNFNSALDALGKRFPEDETLSRRHLSALNRAVFQSPYITWYIQYAVFDLVMMAKEGIRFKGPIHCTKAAGRVIYNEHMTYGLDDQAEREFSQGKDDGVKRFLAGHHHLTPEERKINTSLKGKIKRREAKGDFAEAKKLKEQLIVRLPLKKKISIPGKTGKKEQPFFHRVPKDIIVPYGNKDAELVRKLGEHQQKALAKRPIWPVESKISQICTDMVVQGIKIDRAYCEKAIGYELSKKEEEERNFEKLTGIKFKDGRTCLVKAFEKLNLSYPTTEKGNPSFKSDVLEKLSNPVAEQILRIRHHDKMASTYYSSFLYYADHNDFIHAMPKPAGTRTGRFSYGDPNLQNVPKEDDVLVPFRVRQAFIPDSSEQILFMVDYDQQEFRMMLDYAGELGLIDRINKGEDVHQATAELAGVTRKQAKTLNYGLLYGMGVAKLGHQLGVDVEEARTLKRRYFKNLPQVKEFINTCTRVAEQQGYVKSWAGRIFFFPNTDFAYKAANAVIQGGCADALKIAMIRLADLLSSTKSHMKIQVHDELVFGIDKSELYLCEQIIDIMESIYTPFNGLKLTCSASWSDKSWGYGDKVEGVPTEKDLLDKEKKVG